MNRAAGTAAGEVAEGLVRTHGVVDFFPLAEFTIEFFHLQRAGSDLIELLGVGAVGAFDGAVEFRRTWWKYEQAQAALLTGGFELGGELAAAIDLHRANGKGHAVQHGLEELGGGEGGGASVGLNHVPARDHIAGGELFEDHAGQGTHVESIDLHQIAGPGNRVLLGFADGIGPERKARRLPGTALRGASISRPCRFSWVEDTAHHGVETASFCWRSRTASLSLPQRG